jgi:hypothetical protein
MAKKKKKLSWFEVTYTVAAEDEFDAWRQVDEALMNERPSEQMCIWEGDELTEDELKELE